MCEFFGLPSHKELVSDLLIIISSLMIFAQLKPCARKVAGAPRASAVNAPFEATGNWHRIRIFFRRRKL
jgi:hypothetical protein